MRSSKFFHQILFLLTTLVEIIFLHVGSRRIFKATYITNGLSN